MVKEETRPTIAGLTLSCLLNKKYLILFTSSKYSTYFNTNMYYLCIACAATPMFPCCMFSK